MGLLGKLLNRPPTRDEFVAIVVRRFAEIGVFNLDHSAADFSLRRRGTDQTLFLTNMYQNYCAAERGEKKLVLARFVDSFASTPAMATDFASAAPHLMPVLRDFRALALTRLAVEASSATTMPAWPEVKFAHELNLVLAYDTELTIQSPNDETIAGWGVGIEEALKLAKENLRDRTDPKGFKEIANGVFLGEWADSYEAARMVLPDYFYRLSLNGPPVAFAPNRDVLLVCGSFDTAGLGVVLKHGAETHISQGHPLSPNLYVLEEGRWEIFVPEDAGLRSQLLAVQRRREAIDYTEQKRCLDEINTRAKRDSFVATYTLAGRKDGTEFTYCVWTKGVDSMLPKTDEVALLVNPVAVEGGPKDIIWMIWETLVRECPELLEEVTGMVPVRYRAESFPVPETIERLRGMARPKAR